VDEQHTRLAGLETCLISRPLQARAWIVMLHGYNMRASDLTPFAHSMGIPGAAYAFPQAPDSVSATGYAWWPISRLTSPVQPNIARDLWRQYPEGRENARALLREFLVSLRARRDMPVILAGFSQGGMLACDTVLMEDVEVAGLAMLSSSCIAAAQWQERRERLNGMRAFVSHGRADPDLSFNAGRRLADFMTSAGAALTWAPFDGGHEIPLVAWRRFKQFVQAILRGPTQDTQLIHEAH
jgi:phospholipase/carboxylesterase